MVSDSSSFTNSFKSSFLFSFEPFQFLVCFNQICDVACQHLSSTSFALLLVCSIESSQSSSWFAVVVVILCAVFFLSIFACFVATNVFSSSMFCLFLFVRMMIRSIRRWVVRSILFVSYVPAPYGVLSVTTTRISVNDVVRNQIWM